MGARLFERGQSPGGATLPRRLAFRLLSFIIRRKNRYTHCPRSRLLGLMLIDAAAVAYTLYGLSTAGRNSARRLFAAPSIKSARSSGRGGGRESESIEPRESNTKKGTAAEWVPLATVQLEIKRQSAKINNPRLRTDQIKLLLVTPLTMSPRTNFDVTPQFCVFNYLFAEAVEYVIYFVRKGQKIHLYTYEMRQGLS